MVESMLACERCGGDVTERGACLRCQEPASSPPSRPSRHDCEEAARIPLTADAVLDLLRQHFADVDSIFVHPYVPATKENAARLAHAAHLPGSEPILALYDDYVLDASVHEGFVVTPTRICWKNHGEPACSVAWSALDPDNLYVDGAKLFLGDEALALAETEVKDACANAFHVLALSGLPPPPAASSRVLSRDTLPARRSASPPPPHTTSYFAYASHAETRSPDCSCWHCQTPLYATTPRCSFCGVTPKPTGWLRTA